MSKVKINFKIHHRNSIFNKEIEYFLSFLKFSYQIEFVDQNDADYIIYYGYDEIRKPGLYIPDNLLHKILYINKQGVSFRNKEMFVRELKLALDPINFSENSNSLVVIQNDIVTISFCILSRIEEVEGGSTDLHNRYKIENDSVYQSGFYGKPVIDYLLENMVQKLTQGIGIPFESEYSIICTHDVDRLKSYHSFFKSLRTVIGELVKRRNVSRFFSRIYEEFYLFEPWSSLYKLKKIYNKKNVNVIFMIMGKSHHPSDSEYYLNKMPLLKRFIQHISRCGYEVGLHPGFLTYNNEKIYKDQRKSIEELCGCRITSTRQHVLKFNICKTPIIAEENGISCDYTLSFPEVPGFRNGTTRGMNAYNFSKREMLGLKLVSTSIMDLTFHEDKYAQLGGREFYYAKKLIDECYGFNGKIVFLYHTGFIVHRWHKMYRRFLDYAIEKS
jgi:hypothetical protein